MFASVSQEYLDTMQALFRGKTEYREVARFSEGYFMPEYRVTNRLVGDQSRNYVTEVVVFQESVDDSSKATSNAARLLSYWAALVGLRRGPEHHH